jgi:transcriptional regulator with XRE-family HTH domain
MNIQKQFGKALRECRIQRNLSQEKLAELCGLHRTYISDVERGDRNISLVNIHKIASALHINISSIFNILEQNIKEL